MQVEPRDVPRPLLLLLIRLGDRSPANPPGSL